jgi:DNA-binding XRE family transcriptional regulator
MSSWSKERLSGKRRRREQRWSSLSIRNPKSGLPSGSQNPLTTVSPHYRIAMHKYSLYNTIDAWLCELEAAVQERTLKANPEIKNKALESESRIKVTEIDKHIFISIGKSEHPRFAIDKKSNIIYGIKGININKKECYGPVSEWRQWNWESYYPHKNSLYDWKKMKTKRPTHPKKPRQPKILKAGSLWLKRSRGKLGLTQIQLAAKIGISAATIRDWENEGLPTKGTGAQTARRVIEEMFREKGGRDKQIEIGLDGQPYEVPQPQD